jgi:hypothetical protein
VYNIHGGDEKWFQNFGRNVTREETICEIQHGWQNNIKMGLTEIGHEDGDCMYEYLAKDNDKLRILLNTGNKPSDSVKRNCWTPASREGSIHHGVLFVVVVVIIIIIIII